MKIRSAFRAFHNSTHASGRSRRRVRTFESLEARQMLTIRFIFDYSLDTNNFFNSQSKKDLLEYAGKMLGQRFDDTLKAISPSGSNKWTATISNPSTGSSKSFNNLSLAENTIRVYVGGRGMSNAGLGGSLGFSSSGTSAWSTLVRTRGQTGATGSSPTDVAPRVGSIAFDTTGRSWFFGKTTSGLDDGEVDFLSVAMHELTHILGIGKSSSTTSWSRLISSGNFTGTKTRAVYGRNVPVDSGLGHFRAGVQYQGIEVAMDPDILDGTRKLHGPVDFAALDDIGWAVNTKDDSIFQAAQKVTHIEDPEFATEDSILVKGSIGSSKDIDMYRIYAEEGATVSVRATPTGFDSYLRLYNGSGASVKSGDQGGSGERDSYTYKLPRTDYYWVAISSYDNRGYDPFVVSSGPGGTTGSYNMTITIGDPSIRAASQSSASSLTKASAGNLTLPSATNSGGVVLSAGSLTGATMVQNGTLDASGFATGSLATSATSLQVAGATAMAPGTVVIPAGFSIASASNPLLGTTGSDQTQPQTKALNESLIDAALEDSTDLSW